MNENCYFEHDKFCSALKVKKCKNCVFRKTEAEFIEGSKHAEKILESKGLVRYEHNDINGVNCMGVTHYDR